MKIKQLLILLGFLMASTAFAIPGEFDHFDKPNVQPQKPTEPQNISASGIVRCEGGCLGGADSCNLEFVRYDGEVFDLENDKKLRTLHCQDHSRDLQITLKGEKIDSFLFGDDNIRLASFKITGEVPAKNCNKERNSSVRHVREYVGERHSL